MKLILYELRKLCGIKYLWVTLAVMTAAFAVMLGWRYDVLSCDRELNDMGRDLAEEYVSDPVRINAVMESLDRDTATYKLGCVRKNGERVPDGDVINMMWRKIADPLPFYEYADNVISTTEGMMSFGGAWLGEDSPAYEYQSHMHDRYVNAREKVAFGGVGPGDGWNYYFYIEDIGIFVCVYVILLTCAACMHERACGTTAMIRTSRGGRIKTSLAKLASLVIADVFIVFVFSAAAWLLFAVVYGCSGGGMPVQTVIPTTVFVQSIWQFALLQFLMRAVTAAAFSLVIAFASSVTYSPIVSYVTGALMLVANIAVNYYVTYSPWLELNMLNAMTTRLIESYYEMYVAAHFYPQYAVAIFMWLLVATVGFAASAAAGSVRYVRIRVPRRLRRPQGDAA